MPHGCLRQREPNEIYDVIAYHSIPRASRIYKMNDPKTLGVSVEVPLDIFMADPSRNISHVLQCADLPNPFTPMAFLPPKLAFEAKFAEFVVACSLAILIWDQLHTLSDDYQLAFKKHVRWPTVVYFISRISTLVFLVVKNVQLNAQTNHCESLRITLCISFVFARASTAFLMYFRVCAVYGMNRFIVLFFGLTWLLAVGGATTPFHGMKSSYIGPTKYCASVVKDDYLIALSLTDLGNDILILLAIMYKLGVTDSGRNPNLQIPSAWKSTGRLHTFTRVFLQDSQVYYAITVVLNLATIITFFAVDSPRQSPFRFTIIFPTASIVNIMACRVFRNVKLGRYSRVFLAPAHIEAGNQTQQDCKPIINGENSYHMGDMNTPDISRKKELWRFPATDSQKLGTEMPGGLGGVEVTKVIELSRD